MKYHTVKELNGPEGPRLVHALLQVSNDVILKYKNEQCTVRLFAAVCGGIRCFFKESTENGVVEEQLIPFSHGVTIFLEQNVFLFPYPEEE